MTAFVALLRAVNVGGTGKLPMRSSASARCVPTSKLVIPAAKTGTARNMNTVATLAKMAAKL